MQEVAHNRFAPQVGRYFLAQLNQELTAKGLSDFSYSLDSQGKPLSESGVRLLMPTGGESFAQMVLPNKNKYHVLSAGARNDLVPAQVDRIFEIQLQPKNPAMVTTRRIWNVHLKWQADASHHQHVQALIGHAVQAGATIAGDTNAPIITLLREVGTLLDLNACYFAEPANTYSGNKVLGKPDQFVDAIITPKSAAHLQPRLPMPSPIPPQAAPLLLSTPPKASPKPKAPKVAKMAPKPKTPRLPKAPKAAPKPKAPVPSPVHPDTPVCENIIKGATGLIQLHFATLADATQYASILFQKANITNQFGLGPKSAVNEGGKIFLRLTQDEYNNTAHLINKSKNKKAALKRM